MVGLKEVVLIIMIYSGVKLLKEVLLIQEIQMVVQASA